MSRRQILVVDDSAVVRALARIGLESVAGWDVRAVESGREAVRCAAADRPEAILLDVVMPEMDGPATLLDLQSRDETSAIPVIFVTAKDLPQERAQLESLGVAGVIAKPFDVQQLGAQVCELLGWTP